MGRKNNRSHEEPQDFVPYSKSSKKEKRKRDREKRGDWGNISPVTKIVPNKKKEKRRRRRDNYYEEDDDYNY